jgi:hypothetical protein
MRKIFATYGEAERQCYALGARYGYGRYRPKAVIGGGWLVVPLFDGLPQEEG